MLTRFRDLLFRAGPPGGALLTEEPQRLSRAVEVAPTDGPIEILLGGLVLDLYPEARLEPGKAQPTDWILLDRDRYFAEVAGFARIASGERVLVGRANLALQDIFRFPSRVRRRHLEIQNDDGRISIRPLDPEGETEVRKLNDAQSVSALRTERLRNLGRVRELFGGPLVPLSAEAACSTVQRLNEVMQTEPYRAKDSEGRPGGLLDLPDRLSPIVVGDLHAQVDNLLKILSEGSHLDALARDEACLVLLGDAIHSENDGELEQMETSFLTLDLIFQLKLRFPGNVFYLRGNHESFEERVSKCGVPQGLLFLKRARELRGERFVEQLQAFYDLQPYVVRSRNFIACHAGPPQKKTQCQDLIDIRTHPEVETALVWSRHKGPRHPTGYSKRHVRRFRSSLDVAEDTPLIVSHTPLSIDGTVWKNVSGIENHHILYSAHPDRLGIFIRSGSAMVALEYPAEPLIDLTNRLDVAMEANQAAAG